MNKRKYPRRQILTRREERRSFLRSQSGSEKVYSCFLECGHYATLPFEKKPRKSTGCVFCWEQEQKAASPLTAPHGAAD